MEDLEKKLLGGAAYKLFFDECKLHYQACMEAFAEDRTFSEDELKLLANRMHTIKGGSGFFKLTELTKVTGQLEKLFGQGAQGISDKNLIQSLLTQFANCVENLVPPKAS